MSDKESFERDLCHQIVKSLTLATPFACSHLRRSEAKMSRENTSGSQEA